MQLPKLIKLFYLAILPFIFVSQTLAQNSANLPISQVELEAQFQTQLFGSGASELTKETRFGNLEKLNLDKTSIQPLLGDNQAPTFEIAPEIRTLRVGEQKLFNFSFSDEENDPYFGGVIALNTRIELDAGRKPKKQIAREAPIIIDVLGSPDPSIVNWNITGQNPGVAIFFVSIAEIFSTNEGGVFRLFAGRIKFVAYAFRVIGDNDDTLPPTFVNKLEDIKLQLKEKAKLFFVAESPENRPLTYNFLYLAYASRLVNGRFFGNNAEIKAIDPGRGVFIAFASDGRKADLQTFIVTVADPKDPVETELKVRTLAEAVKVISNKSQGLDVYGENFSLSTQVMLKSPSRQEQVPVQFISKTNLRILLPTDLKEKITLQFIDNGQTASTTFQPLAPVAIDIKRVKNNSNKFFKLKLLGVDLARGVKVTANGKFLNILEDRNFRSSIVDQITVLIPVELREDPNIELKLVGTTGLESSTILVPLTK